MKRIPALQPLSREHHTALTLAKACERAVLSNDAEQVEKACRRVINAFAEDLEPHFRIEEESWLPLLQSAANKPLEQRALEEHRQLRASLEGLRRNDVGALNDFGKLLTEHVRFEERELFPALEKLLP